MQQSQKGQDESDLGQSICDNSSLRTTGMIKDLVAVSSYYCNYYYSLIPQEANALL